MAGTVLNEETAEPLAHTRILVRVLSGGEQLGEASEAETDANGLFTSDVLLGWSTSEGCMFPPTSFPPKTAWDLNPDQVQLVVRTDDFQGTAAVNLVEEHLDRANFLIRIPPVPVELIPRQDTVYGVGDGPIAGVVADLDGDQSNDLVILNFGESTISILRNNGDGTFADGPTIAVSESSRSVTAADFDGDADIDLAVGSKSGNSVTVWLNNGDGTFPDSVEIPLGSAEYSIRSGDLDNDADVDLVVLGSDYPGPAHIKLLSP